MAFLLEFSTATERSSDVIIASMQFSLLFAMFLAAIQIPPYDPNGVWQAETGSKFNLQLSGKDLKVNLVDGSNPRYLKYEVNLKNVSDEMNTYEGTGYFVAKLQNGKECEFETNWKMIVVSPERILGVVSSIVPDPETCAVKTKSDIQLDLQKQ
jgi:hypothetical protein